MDLSSNTEPMPNALLPLPTLSNLPKDGSGVSFGRYGLQKKLLGPADIELYKRISRGCIYMGKGVIRADKWLENRIHRSRKPAAFR